MSMSSLYGIREVSQLTERCKEEWEGVTVVKKCDRRFVSWWGGVMVCGEVKGLDRKGDSHQGGVKGIK